MPPAGPSTICIAVNPPIVRDPSQIRSHAFRGTTPEFLENAVTMTLSADLDGTRIAASVSITNDRTGHHVPTGVTIRNMILVVDAWREENGNGNGGSPPPGCACDLGGGAEAGLLAASAMLLLGGVILGRGRPRRRRLRDREDLGI
jgi:hypothetical protein